MDGDNFSYRSDRGYPQATTAPRRGGGLGGLLVAALVGALVATVVSFGVTSQDQQPDGNPLTGEAPAEEPPEAAVEQAADEEPAPEPGSQPPTDDDVVIGASVADVAEDVLPSVAQVLVTGARGTGSGSAVVYSEDGYLVTNNHVVEGAAEVAVVLADGTTLNADVVGTDPASDLAVLQVDAGDLPAVEFAQDTPRPGETAIAIGSPFGLNSTVTSGIISATERQVPTAPGAPPLVDMLQTDAAINPGNSGGALVNAQGELIGINTAIFSRTGTSSGIGFAVPASTVQLVAEQLIEQGFVEYALLGVTTQPVTPAIAQQFDLAAERGALVIEGVAGSGAGEAGVERGDIITGLGGEEIGSPSDLLAAVRGFAPDDETALTVLRDGEELELEVTFGTRETQR